MYAYIIRLLKKACHHIPGRQIVSNYVKKVYPSIGIFPASFSVEVRAWFCDNKQFMEFV